MEQTINKKKHPVIGKIIFWVFTGILAAAFFSAIFAIAVTFLWNWLMTDIFNLPAINYLQAFGLVILARLLVGGWHKGHHDKKHDSHFHHFFKKKTYDNNEDDFSGKNFKDYWEKEGKEAFNNYLNKNSVS